MARGPVASPIFGRVNTMKQAIWPSLLLFALAACGGQGTDAGNNTPPGAGAEAPANTAGTPSTTASADDRDAWQKPEVVLDLIAFDGPLNGRTVAHLFAGDGYFTFKLAERGARVIAIVGDQGAADALTAERDRRGYTSEQVEVRVMAPGTTGLGMEEAELALFASSYAAVPDRVAFFRQVRNGLRSPHRLWVIDFLTQESPVGPPMELRMPITAIMDELGEAGYADVASRSNMLPYQFIMVGQDVIEAPSP